MKTLSILALCTAIIMASCQKSSVSPSLNATTENDVITARKSNFDFLTTHGWVYNKYYIGYVDSSNKGTLVYKRGGNRNTLDLDSVRENYYPDGTVDEYQGNGVHIYGTWHFTNNQQSEVEFSNYTGNYFTTIVTLDRKRFYCYYTDIYGVKRYGELVYAP